MIVSSLAISMSIIVGLPIVAGLRASIFASIICLLVSCCARSYLGTLLLYSALTRNNTTCDALGVNAIICFMMRSIIERQSDSYDCTYSDPDRLDSMGEGQLDEMLEICSTTTIIAAAIFVS